MAAELWPNRPAVIMSKENVDVELLNLVNLNLSKNQFEGLSGAEFQHYSQNESTKKNQLKDLEGQKSNSITKIKVYRKNSVEGRN